jgi:hypothetical protein
VLTRSISQYLYLASFMEPSCVPTWEEFCEDPFVLGDACKGHFEPDESDECCKAPASGVHQYGHVSILTKLAHSWEGPTSCVASITRLSRMCLQVHPQADCFVTEEGETAVDFIGRVESFHEDFSSLIDLMNERVDAPKLPPPGRLQKNTGSSRCTPAGRSSGNSTRRLLDRPPSPAVSYCDKMDFFRGPHASCYSSLLSFYGDDVRLLMPA